MRKESRILTYIPREFHSRFEAMRNLANVMRFEQRCKTRIKMGNMDLQLHRKDRDNGRWERVQSVTSWTTMCSTWNLSRLGLARTAIIRITSTWQTWTKQ